MYLLNASRLFSRWMVWPHPVNHGDVIEYEVPDMYGRPWAQIWDSYFEQDMDKPDTGEDIFSFE